MTRRLVLRPQAVADLSDIWDYTIGVWSRDQGETYLRALNKAFLALAEFPDMARRRDEFTPPVRVHRFRKHVIIYMETSDTLDVIRVVHGKSNWTAFLAE